MHGLLLNDSTAKITVSHFCVAQKSLKSTKCVAHIS